MQHFVDYHYSSAFLPAALATVAYSLLPGKRESNYRWIALVVSVVEFALSLLLIRGVGSKDFKFVDDVLWIGSIGAHYHVGVDGYQSLAGAVDYAINANRDPL